MYALIQKWTDGIEFMPCSSKGKPRTSKLGEAARLALSAAEVWYKAEVLKAFAEAGLADSGYAEQFNDAFPRTRGDHKFMQLEPVGFAIEDEHGAWAMNNCGSTPTPGRARSSPATRRRS